MSEKWDSFIVYWTHVIKSPDEDYFYIAWAAFIEKYKDYELVINYINKTWLPFKEKFICEWTDKILHFENHATSRVEGAHSKLKKYIQVLTGDLRDVKDKICLAIDNEFQEIKMQLSHEKIRIPHKFRIPLFCHITGHVLLYAHNELFKQYELAISDVSSICKGNFTNSMGIPCAHKIKMINFQPLQLSDIHQHWRLDLRSFTFANKETDEIGGLLEKIHENYQRMPLTLKEDVHEKLVDIIGSSIPLTHEPRAHPHKGRPSQRKNKRSIIREPSLFEIVDGARSSHR